MQASNFTSLISPLQDTHLPYDHMWPTFQQIIMLVYYFWIRRQQTFFTTVIYTKESSPELSKPIPKVYVWMVDVAHWNIDSSSVACIHGTVSSQSILHDHLSGFITLFNWSSFLYKEANDEATLTIEHKTEISHNNFMQMRTNNLVTTQANKALGNKKRKKNVKINL